MTTNDQIKKWAIVAEEEFKFLETNGYKEPIKKLETAWGVITYTGPKLGIRLEVETDEFFMFLAVFRPSDPTHDASLYLQECLHKLGIPDAAISSVHQFRGEYDAFPKMLSIFAEALRSNLAVLEGKVSELFPR